MVYKQKKKQYIYKPFITIIEVNHIIVKLLYIYSNSLYSNYMCSINNINLKKLLLFRTYLICL